MDIFALSSICRLCGEFGTSELARIEDAAMKLLLLSSIVGSSEPGRFPNLNRVLKEVQGFVGCGNAARAIRFEKFFKILVELGSRLDEDFKVFEERFRLDALFQKVASFCSKKSEERSCNVAIRDMDEMRLRKSILDATNDLRKAVFGLKKVLAKKQDVVEKFVKEDLQARAGRFGVEIQSLPDIRATVRSPRLLKLQVGPQVSKLNEVESFRLIPLQLSDGENKCFRSFNTDGGYSEEIILDEFGRSEECQSLHEVRNCLRRMAEASCCSVSDLLLDLEAISCVELGFDPIELKLLNPGNPARANRSKVVWVRFQSNQSKKMTFMREKDGFLAKIRSEIDSQDEICVTNFSNKGKPVEIWDDFEDGDTLHVDNALGNCIETSAAGIFDVLVRRLDIPEAVEACCSSLSSVLKSEQKADIINEILLEVLLTALALHQEHPQTIAKILRVLNVVIAGLMVNFTERILRVVLDILLSGKCEDPEVFTEATNIFAAISEIESGRGILIEIDFLPKAILRMAMLPIKRSFSQAQINSMHAAATLCVENGEACQKFPMKVFENIVMKAPGSSDLGVSIASVIATIARFHPESLIVGGEALNVLTHLARKFPNTKLLQTQTLMTFKEIFHNDIGEHFDLGRVLEESKFFALVRTFLKTGDMHGEMWRVSFALSYLFGSSIRSLRNEASILQSFLNENLVEDLIVASQRGCGNFLRWTLRMAKNLGRKCSSSRLLIEEVQDETDLEKDDEGNFVRVKVNPVTRGEIVANLKQVHKEARRAVQKIITLEINSDSIAGREKEALAKLIGDEQEYK